MDKASRSQRGKRDSEQSASHFAESATHASERNKLLHALTSTDYDRLRADLMPVSLETGRVLIEPNEDIATVYFIRDGVASMVATEQEGGLVEVGTVGNEGLVGIPVVLGTPS